MSGAGSVTVASAGFTSEACHRYFSFTNWSDSGCADFIFQIIWLCLVSNKLVDIHSICKNYVNQIFRFQAGQHQTKLTKVEPEPPEQSFNLLRVEWWAWTSFILQPYLQSIGFLAFWAVIQSPQSSVLITVLATTSSALFTTRKISQHSEIYFRLNNTRPGP